MPNKQIPQHELCKNASTKIYAIFNDRRFQKWAFERRSDFRSGKKKTAINRKNKMVSITLRLREIRWKKSMILTEMPEPLFRETTSQLRLRETNYPITNPAQLSVIDKLTLRRHKYRHREAQD